MLVAGLTTEVCWDLQGKPQSRADVPSKSSVPGQNAKHFLLESTVISGLTSLMDSSDKF
jgi:hypothetical protein